METLESSRVCRLCGQHSGISINIFDENENHVRKINAVLPIMVHEMDLLPKQMCHRCSYKLEEFHKFYVDCLKTDAALKSQLSWMRKSHGREKIGVPMVHIENVKIKAEPLDYDVYELEPLVENLDYINSMSSMAFPAGGIHDGLTYAAFSRYRCCCDKKDQSRSRRTTAELCQNYEDSMSRCGGIADDSRKRRVLESTAARLRPIKRNLFTQEVFPDCPQNHLPRVDTVENARDRLITDANIKDDVSSLGTRSHCHRFEDMPRQAASRNTIVRNLRPRKNLVNYASNKRTSDISPGPSTVSKSNVRNPKVTLALNLEPVVELRQIKVEQMNEYEGRSLRPRRNTVDYQEPKMRKVLSEYRAKKRKTDDAGQNSKLYSRNKNSLNALERKIKREAIDDLEDTVLDQTTSATSRLPNKLVKFTDLPAKVEVLTSDDETDYQPQYRNKFQVAKQKSLSNIVKNRLAKTKKVYRFPVGNYSPKFLRSQDAYLRNGKARKNDYAEWSMKRLQTKKMIDVINKNTKKVPTMLKLSESIKHYCETCNVSFMNKELFRLHACYYD